MRWVIEFSEEVRDWYVRLTPTGQAATDRILERLASQGNMLHYQVHVADRYNWDGNKATTILGMTITDKQLQELHQTGLAQEYDLVGESSVRTESNNYEAKPK